MALGSTQPVAEMSTRNLPGGKERPAPKADNLTAIREPTVQKMWEPRRLTNLWAFRACYRNSSTFLYRYTLLLYNYSCLLLQAWRLIGQTSDSPRLSAYFRGQSVSPYEIGEYSVTLASDAVKWTYIRQSSRLLCSNKKLDIVRCLQYIWHRRRLVSYLNSHLKTIA
jgi:hypothetical protein